MVSTRSKGSESAPAGDKRPPSPLAKRPSTKRPKKEKDGELKIGENGEVGLKKDEEDQLVQGKDDQGLNEGDNEDQARDQQEEVNDKEEDVQAKKATQKGEVGDEGKNRKQGPDVRSGKGETTQEGDEVSIKASQSSELDEPKHGTLESGHIYFLYRPKIDADEVNSVDDVSKFHIVLIPTSPSHTKGQFHRVIEVGKKKLPDPGAKHQVIWGLVGSVGGDRDDLKQAFGAYTYETKTRGTRHQQAARPAARGHYILHSPRDELADDPDHNRQRDFKMILAYEITTPAHEDFGAVQRDLGLEEKGAVALQVKDPDVQSNNNPRAAAIPREKRAQYPQKLMDLFRGRRFIPANPPSFLSYSGTELLIISSPHELHDSLGKEGEKVEHDMDEDAKVEAKDVEGAMNELGMSEKDTEIEALEGAWA